MISPPPNSPQTSTAPRARSALVLLLGINLLNYLDRQILSAVLPRIREEFFVTIGPDGQRVVGENAETSLGLLTTAFLVSYMLTAPVFGLLADRWRRWALIGIGVIVWSLASGGTGLAQSFGVLVLMRILVGVGEGAYGPTAPTIISDLYPVRRRGSVLAWFYMAIPVGSALGFVLGGAVATSLGWHWAFWVTLPPGVVLGAWCFFMREPVRGTNDPGAARRRLSARDYRVLLRTPAYVYNTAAMTAMTFALGGLAAWMPDYLHTYRGVSEEHASISFGAIVVGTGLSGTFIGGWLGDALRPRWGGSYLLVSGLGMFIGLPMFIGVLVAPFPLAWVFLALAVFFLFLNTGPSNTAIANVTHPGLRASAFAINILVIHTLGDAISPVVIGAIKDATSASPRSFDIAFLAVAAMFPLAGALWLLGARHLALDTQRAPHSL